MGHFSQHQTYCPSRICNFRITYYPRSGEFLDCFTKSLLYRLWSLPHESQILTMNQVIVATENRTSLKTSLDALVRKTPSDRQLDTVGEKASRRRIRFTSTVSKVVGRVLSRDDFSEDEKADYWMGGKEFCRNQSKTKTVVTTVQKHGPVFVRSLEDSYEEAQNLSEFMVDDNAIELFFEDPSGYTEKMEMWSAANFGQRGLEKYISPLQKSQRALEKRETRLVVLIAARKGASVDQLAVLYSALSWMTCIYSRMLGHADYIAAHSEEDAAPVQLKAVQMPTLKKEHHVQAVPKQSLKLHTPSQDMRIQKQGRLSTQGSLVSRSV
jgi:hypothetical protein